MSYSKIFLLYDGEQHYGGSYRLLEGLPRIAQEEALNP